MYFFSDRYSLHFPLDLPKRLTASCTSVTWDLVHYYLHLSLKHPNKILVLDNGADDLAVCE